MWGVDGREQAAHEVGCSGAHGVLHVSLLRIHVGVGVADEWRMEYGKVDTLGVVHVFLTDRIFECEGKRRADDTLAA